MATGAWFNCALVQEGSRLRFFFDGINRGDFPLNSFCNGVILPLVLRINGKLGIWGILQILSFL